MINCSENCIHCKDGICDLKTVLTSSSTPTDDCPFYKEKKKKEDIASEK